MASRTSLLAGMLAGVALFAGCQRTEQPALGERLFRGEEPIAAAIAGHDSSLPVQASRCVNCHVRGQPLEGAVQNAPLLAAATLSEPRARRGGPPSSYDARALCRVLRDGVDPADVMITRAMPRYRIDDAQCEALWRYLTAI